MDVVNRKDVLLLLLYSPGLTESANEKICGRTRLVKMLFLFWKEVFPTFKKGGKLDEEHFYRFFPWNFGPFSTEVYDDLTFFLLRGFIESASSDEQTASEAVSEWQKWLNSAGIDSHQNVIAYEEECFQLTDAGITFSKRVYETLSVGHKQLLKEFKKRLAKAPLQAILHYVYTTYPDMTLKSLIREQVLHPR